MNTGEYNTTMELLGCRSAREAADLIGCCERMARYYAKGNPIPLVVAKRLRGELELRRLRNVVQRLQFKGQSEGVPAFRLTTERF